MELTTQGGGDRTPRFVALQNVTRRQCGLLAVFLLTACGSAAPPTPVTHDLSGTLTLRNGDRVYQSATGCQGTGGYADIDQTLQVVVKSDAGAIIGTSALTSRRPPQTSDVNVTATNNRSCFFDFTVKALPVAAFYSVEVGRRGAVTYSKADLEAAGWKIETNIGN